MTFTGHRYRWNNRCNNQTKCLSSYRIRDGFVNCVDKMDEAEVGSNALQLVLIQMQEYRFRCSADELTWLSVAALGNIENNCQNKFDELWFGTSSKLADINCKKSSKDQCHLLRQYVKDSWLPNSNVTGINTQLRISFRQYCDTFWNLISSEDENSTDCNQWWMCPDEQWRCGTGQCIDKKWVMDGEWDCSDASDEDEFSKVAMTDRNQRVVSLEIFTNKLEKLNRSIPFSSICNLQTEWPCLPKNFSGSLDIFPPHRPCIDRTRIGNGHIDCYGGIDERNTISQCHRSTMLGYHFQCPSNLQCIPYWNHCIGDRCNVSSNDQFWCGRRENLMDCSNFEDAVCFNGTCLKNSRCNRISDCSFGEDEYMCEYKSILKLTGFNYRQDKEIATINTKQKLHLISYPPNSSIMVSTTQPSTTTTTSTTSTTTPAPGSSDGQLAFWCNRGVGVKLYNGSSVCFCPPQYYGDKCQYHSDRILVLLHLDLSQSIYTIKTDVQHILKILVVFLFNDEVIANQIFHVRPSTDMIVYVKKFLHFPYSRARQSLQYKRQRYFNRSKIIHEHPFSVRIEIYERKDTGEPELYLVWQYPIYFDYLPVFRLAKVLRLTIPDPSSDPCSSNPCNQNQDCRQLQNNKSNYICLCKRNFTGPDCLEPNSLCMRGYCANQSICKPNYRGSLVGDQFPFCLCSFDLYGDQCEIRHDQCTSDPCQNGGSCYSTSKPDTVACICTKEYYGKHCELRKPSVELYINESVEHVAAVVQYFNIDFVRLNLLLSYQELNRKLPSSLQYRHGKETAPELIIVKIYSSSSVPTSPRLYLISVQLNAQTINGTTQVNQQTECLSVSSLKSSYSPMQYHRLCQKNESLYCFEDGYYLCVCVDNNSRVECFGYDYRLDRCSECLSDGVCVKGDGSTMRNDIICVCPMCYSGSRCQFNSNSFSFTLDHLFYPDLISSNSKIIVGILILIPLFVFLIALPNNIFSLMTFRRPRCLCNGIGQYLLYMSVVNQINLAFLCARLIHLVVNIKGLHSHPLVDLYLCKIFSYLLTTTSRMVYWFSSLVAIERVYMTLFLNGRWLRKPHLARRLIYSTMLIILISNVHELIFVESLNGIYNDKDGMCVIHFPDRSRSTWTLFHLILSTLHSILPFIINISCTLTISCLVARNKISAHKTPADDYGKKTVSESRLGHLRSDIHFAWEVVNENKELVIGPGITLIPQLFSLPLFIVSFTLYCQNLENSWMRYVLIVCYFISFVPQMTSFMLYVSPSSFYSSEWYATKMGKWFNRFRGVNTPVPAITTIWETTKQENAQD